MNFVEIVADMEGFADLVFGLLVVRRNQRMEGTDCVYRYLYLDNPQLSPCKLNKMKPVESRTMSPISVMASPISP